MVNLQLPPIIRFLNELVYWVWMLLLGWWIPLILSLLTLSLINFPGDKKAANVKMPGIYTAGWIRIIVEISWGIIGIYAGYKLGMVYFAIQVILVLFSLWLDRERYLWMLGRIDDPPGYVTNIHS